VALQVVVGVGHHGVHQFLQRRLLLEDGLGQTQQNLVLLLLRLHPMEQPRVLNADPGETQVASENLPSTPPNGYKLTQHNLSIHPSINKQVNKSINR